MSKIQDEYNELDDININDKDRLEALEKIFEDPVIRTYFQARRATIRHKIIKLTSFATSKKPNHESTVNALSGMLYFVDNLLDTAGKAYGQKQKK